jgi:translation elongation factor EF-Tu-like GTPase
MARRLFIVEDAFFIKGRGLVTVPGIVPEGDERFRVGDPILLKRPDGSRLEWTIGGLEMIHCTPRRQTDDVFILLKGLNKEDVPVGSEVWSVHTPDPPSAVSGDS